VPATQQAARAIGRRPPAASRPDRAEPTTHTLGGSEISLTAADAQPGRGVRGEATS